MVRMRPADHWDEEGEDAFLVTPQGLRKVGDGWSISGGGQTYGAKSGGVWSVLTPQRLELLKGAVVRLYYSRLTAVLYFGTLVLAGTLLAITLGLDTPLRDAPGALLVLEGLVSLSLFVEVALRAMVIGKEYLRSWSNILDCGFAVMSASLIFWAAPRASESKDFETQKQDVELSQSLVMIRTMVQFGRVLLIAQHAVRSRRANASEEVTFSRLIAGPNVNVDLDFAVLRERELQQRNRSEDFGL